MSGWLIATPCFSFTTLIVIEQYAVDGAVLFRYAFYRFILSK